MEYRPDQNIDNDFTASWIAKIVNRMTGRTPNPADGLPTPTFIYINSSDQDTLAADSDLLNAVKIDQSGTHSGVYGTVLPAPDGAITEFFSEQNFVSSKMEVYKNGKELIQGTDKDWTEGTGLNSVDILAAPLASDKITLVYVTENSTGILIEAQEGATGDSCNPFDQSPNGARTEFTLATGPFRPATMRLYENGKLQIEGAGNEFTMDGDAASVTFTAAPLAGTILASSSEPQAGRFIAQTSGVAATYLTVTGAIPGTIYTAPFKFKPASAVILKNGKRMAMGADGSDDFYLNSNNQVILNSATVANDVITMVIEPYEQPQLAAVKIGTTPVTTTYTVTGSDFFVKADASGAAFTITLPAAATRLDQLPVTIIKTDSSSNTVTVDTTGAETINNEADQELMNEGDSIRIMSDGSNWWIG